jgi:hypothetical protein
MVNAITITIRAVFTFVVPIAAKYFWPSSLAKNAVGAKSSATPVSILLSPKPHANGKMMTPLHDGLSAIIRWTIMKTAPAMPPRMPATVATFFMRESWAWKLVPVGLSTSEGTGIFSVLRLSHLMTLVPSVQCAFPIAGVRISWDSNRLQGPMRIHSVDVTDACCRTPKLSDGEGCWSKEHRKPYVPPPPTAALGSAGLCRAAPTRKSCHTTRTPRMHATRVQVATPG